MTAGPVSRNVTPLRYRVARKPRLARSAAMADASLPTLIDTIADTGHITAADVLKLRRAIYADAAIAPPEAEALIALDEQVPARCREWDQLFCEALTDFLVHQQQ